jgi:hypothetical protein
VQLVKAATVALGAFNPAIPTPHWLAQQGILEHGTFELGTVLTQTGVATRFRRGKLVWMVTLDRLLVETADDGERERPLALTTEILKALPHTPIRAIGVNFDFVLGEPSDAVQTMLQGIDFGALPGTRAETDVSLVQADAATGTQVKLQLINSKGETRAAFNFHSDLPSAAAAIKYLEGASKFYDEARTITARLEK